MVREYWHWFLSPFFFFGLSRTKQELLAHLLSFALVVDGVCDFGKDGAGSINLDFSIFLSFRGFWVVWILSFLLLTFSED